MTTFDPPVYRVPSSTITRNHDALLGPLFYEPFATYLGERIAPAQPEAVLELSCGTGHLTQRLDASLPGTTRIVANEPRHTLLRKAQDKLGGRGLEWDSADAYDLPFIDGSFDVVTSAFGSVLFIDRMASYREASRVLRPRGRMLFSTWSGIERNPAALIAQEVVAAYLPAEQPLFHAFSFSYDDTDIIRDEVINAGFTETTFTQVDLQGYAPTAADAAKGLLEGSPLLIDILDRDPFALPSMRNELTARLTEHFGPTNLHVPLSAWVVEAIVH